MKSQMKPIYPRRALRISFMRKRLQKSGKTYYYFEVPGTAGRKEVSLGNELSIALKRRADLLLAIRIGEREIGNDLLFTLGLYKEIVIPTMEQKSQKENLRTVGNFVDFFLAHKFSFADIESPKLIDLYEMSRKTKSKVRLRNEISFLKRLRNQAQKWRILEVPNTDPTGTRQ